MDETLAIGLAWLFLDQLNLLNLVLLFTLFRFFDIVNPLGIQSIEKQTSWSTALRNAGDDVLAMAYGGIVFKMVQLYLL